MERTGSATAEVPEQNWGRSVLRFLSFALCAELLSGVVPHLFLIYWWAITAFLLLFGARMWCRAVSERSATLASVLVAALVAVILVQAASPRNVNNEACQEVGCGLRVL